MNEQKNCCGKCATIGGACIRPTYCTCHTPLVAEKKEIEFIGGAEKQIEITKIKMGDNYFIPQPKPVVEGERWIM